MQTPTLLQLLAFSVRRPRAVLLFRTGLSCAAFGPHQNAVADACREAGVTFACRDVGEVVKLAFSASSLGAVLRELLLAGRRVTVLSDKPRTQFGA